MLFTKLKNFILDTIFPVFCLGCQKEGSVFCDDCLNKIEISDKPFCPVCRFRLANETPQKDDFHKNCRGKTKLKKLIAAVSYDDPIIKKLIDTYKYQFIKDLDQQLSQLIIKSIFPILSLRDDPGENRREMWQSKNLNKEKLLDPSRFVITAIPLHKKRLQWRGFNQAELLGKKIGQELNIEFKDILKRNKNTKPQVQLNFEDRVNNIKGVFELQDKTVLENKIVLLVDDVYTSGSTMNECAKVLKSAGAKDVWGIVIAK